MTPVNGRDAILARLAVASAADRPRQSSAGHDVTPATYWDDTTLLDRFVQALSRLRVTWEIAESPVVARLTLATHLQDEGVRQVLSWTADHLPIGGVLEALDVLGISVITPGLPVADTRLRPQDLEVRRRHMLGIEAIPVGLTGADAAFAATGTLLMHGGPGRPLLVSQLPRRHIVLLAASRLYPSLERWLAEQPHAPGRPAFPSPVTTLLTGPSRSADIEVTPAFGIHGPGKLHVLVIQGQ
jgi:L-lactate dehydrogenase complex protein LldG